MSRDNGDRRVRMGDEGEVVLQELKLLVPADLCRAWQRCSWLLARETGRERTEIMAEMVHDFLVKYGC